VREKAPQQVYLLSSVCNGRENRIEKQRWSQPLMCSQTTARSPRLERLVHNHGECSVFADNCEKYLRCFSGLRAASSFRYQQTQATCVFSVPIDRGCTMSLTTPQYAATLGSPVKDFGCNCPGEQRAGGCVRECSLFVSRHKTWTCGCEQSPCRRRVYAPTEVERRDSS